jgi:hypothetical protein
MKKPVPPPRKKTDAAPPVELRFGAVVDAFARDRQVTRGGKGFGSSGLKVNGKLFVLLSDRTGRFVAKLPKARVDELVRAGKGEPFDPGHGRLMREWVALFPGEEDWVVVAREACRFVKGGPDEDPVVSRARSGRRTSSRRIAT